MNSLFVTLIIQNENGEELLNVPGASHYEIKNNKSEKVLIVLRNKDKGKFADMVSELYTLN
jgi:rRNA pseudouridine-1189 N-methylase Emg1 (Nep1/Mra1 family)